MLPSLVAPASLELCEQRGIRGNALRESGTVLELADLIAGGIGGAVGLVGLELGHGEAS